MRYFILLGIVAICLAFTPDQERSDAYDQLRECIADHFQINVSQVLLASPNLVYVSTLGGTLEGTASFNDCGILCTEVTLQFSGDQFLCIVEDDIGLL